MWLICFLADEWLLQKLSILKDQKVCVYMCVCSTVPLCKCYLRSAKGWNSCVCLPLAQSD